MISNNLINSIKSRAGQGLAIPVVDGMRTEDLPTPCISVQATDMDNFHASFTDVFNAHILVKYEEHYADITTVQAKANFDRIVDNFNSATLQNELGNVGYKIYDARIMQANQDVQGDILSFELTLKLILEIDATK